MEFVKFLTRKYTLFEHCLIAESLLKKNTSISGVYYIKCMDISRKGLVDIYITKKDLERNKDWVVKCLKKDPRFVENMLKRGLEATEKLSNLPFCLLNKVSKLENKEIIKELFNLKQRFFDFSGYLDFTHYLGDPSIKLSNRNIKRLSKFHDYRKKVFMGYFRFLEKVCKEIAKKKKMQSGNLVYLSFLEIIQFLKGRLTPKEINKLQEKRRRCYIAQRFNNKEVIISDNFEKEFIRIKKNFLKEDIREEIKGIAINKGIVRGRVKIINQTIHLKKISSGEIIVTQMTSPSMTILLQKAGAIITDEGGLLCHAAHVARELGIPCIIGTKIATKVLHDGQIVEVDANIGVVKILNK